MTKYVLTYHGGQGMPESEEEQGQIMAAWGAWFEGLGAAVVDGGNPFGPSTGIKPDGSVTDEVSAPGLSGFSVLDAADMDAAVTMSKGCPILANGGSIQVSEAIDM